MPLSVSKMISTKPSRQGEMGTCRACGLEARGVSAQSWIRDTFTDRDKLLPGEIICHACLFCFAEANEELARKLGKEKPQKMRNYSHFVVAGEWIPLSKGDKARMKEILLHQSPEVVIIAESGQKHIIFRAQPGRWQFEEASLPANPVLLREFLEPIEAMYQAGASKAEIEAGNYSLKSLKQITVSRFLPLEAIIKPMRGSLMMKLALFLARKADEDDSRTDSGESVAPTVEGDQQ